MGRLDDRLTLLSTWWTEQRAIARIARARLRRELARRRLARPSARAAHGSAARSLASLLRRVRLRAAGRGRKP